MWSQQNDLIIFFIYQNVAKMTKKYLSWSVHLDICQLFLPYRGSNPTADENFQASFLSQKYEHLHISYNFKDKGQRMYFCMNIRIK